MRRLWPPEAQQVVDRHYPHIRHRRRLSRSLASDVQGSPSTRVPRRQRRVDGSWCGAHFAVEAELGVEHHVAQCLLRDDECRITVSSGNETLFGGRQ